jgi:two-component system, OmpR family, sensor kinase
MKLLQKTGRPYLFFAAILLLTGGLLIYFQITSIIEVEITEKLKVNQKRLSLLISEGTQVQGMPPVIEVVTFDHPQADQIIVKDTLLFDPIEQDEELFKEVSAVENINGKSYKITLRQVILEPHDYLNSIGISLALVLLLLLMGLYVINRRISISVWKPFYKNLELLKAYSMQAEDKLYLEKSDVQEFKELHAVIEKLTEKIKNDYNKLKEFSENAAHEMQTPLAIISAKLEEMLQTPDLSEAQANLIKSVITPVYRLTGLNKSLLQLTKLDNLQFTEKETLDIKDRIESILAELEDFINAKELSLSKHLEPTLIRMHPYLADILLINLLGNAIKHNYANGSIRIELDDKTLTVSNNGKALNQDPGKMFERFVKANPASTSQGLGLAIVKKICDLNNWQISYETDKEWHNLKIVF